jgi:hypothetical protein
MGELCRDLAGSPELGGVQFFVSAFNCVAIARLLARTLGGGGSCCVRPIFASHPPDWIGPISRWQSSDLLLN